MSSSGTPTSSSSTVGKVVLARTENPLHVASFGKPVVLAPNAELTRKILDFRPYKRRFKPNKFNKIRFNFEARASEEEKKETARENIPWVLKDHDKEHKGRLDRPRSHHYAMAIPQALPSSFLFLFLSFFLLFV